MGGGRTTFGSALTERVDLRIFGTGRTASLALCTALFFASNAITASISSGVSAGIPYSLANVINLPNSALVSVSAAASSSTVFSRRLIRCFFRASCTAAPYRRFACFLFCRTRCGFFRNKIAVSCIQSLCFMFAVRISSSLSASNSAHVFSGVMSAPTPAIPEAMLEITTSAVPASTSSAAAALPSPIVATDGSTSLGMGINRPNSSSLFCRWFFFRFLDVCFGGS